MSMGAGRSNICGRRDWCNTNVNGEHEDAEMNCRNQNQNQITTYNKSCQTHVQPDEQQPSRSRYPEKFTRRGARRNGPRSSHAPQVNLDMARLSISEGPAAVQDNGNVANEIQFPRCSTPTEDICFHCSHDHKERCCLYLTDNEKDGQRYSQWVRSLENPGCNTVRYLFSKSKEQQQRMNIRKSSLPLVWIRQFYYPLLAHQNQHLPESLKESTERTYEGPLIMYQYPHYRYPASDKAPDFIDSYEPLTVNAPSNLYIPPRTQEILKT